MYVPSALFPLDMLTPTPTATSTVTSVLSTLTRSICETSTANHPCYPCIMPTLSFSNHHTVTVTRVCPPRILTRIY